MTTETDKLLTEGLKSGFAGGTTMQSLERGGFNFKSSHLETDGNVYHDEWFADRAGGGQEIVKVGDITCTRVYAGGTIPIEELTTLGITMGDVMNFLKKQMLENGERIRLHTDFKSEKEGDWQYNYQIIERNPKIPLTIGKETITFQEHLVFEHYFIICPVD